MSDPNNTSSEPITHHRRSSFGGQSITGIFEAAKTRQASLSDNAQPTSPHLSGSISSAAFQAHRRRLSLSTVGLIGSGSTQPSPFIGFGAHRDSTSSAASTSIDESAIEDDPSWYSMSSTQQQAGATPLARRMSFGARAFMDAKTGMNSGGPRTMNGTTSSIPRSPIQQTSAFSPTTDGGARTFGGRDNSFGWVDSFCNRGNRSASMTYPRELPSAGFQSRAKSIPTSQQVAPLASPPKHAVPDQYSERILRGEVDF